MKLRALLVGSVLLAAAACTRTLLTHFPHRTHLASLECGAPGQPQCLSCASCHVGDTTTRDSWAPPTAQRCTSCHDDGQAKLVQSVRPALATTPAGKAIVFSHDGHLAQPELKGQCVKCHAGVVGVQGGPPLFPPMDTCLSCHQHRAQFDDNQCTGCHRQKELRGLRPVSFLPHDAAWTRRHGAEARAQPQRCETCHAQASCDACHDATRPLGPAVRNPEKLEAEFVHRFDFLSRHALESSAAPGQCFTCHAKTECDACHATRGVSGGLRTGTSPHPLGWSSGLGVATNSHGQAARRDIASCAACHDQGPVSNCVHCHKVGGLGGTPHPMGWRSSEPASSPQCAACHGGGP